MACKYIYNNQWYTREELEEILTPSKSPMQNLYFSTVYVSDKLKTESTQVVRDDTTNKYIHKDTGNQLDSVTSYIANFQSRPIKTDFDAAKYSADNLWKNLDPTIKQEVKEFNTYGLIDYDTYVKLKQGSYAKFIARAEVYHLKFHKEFGGDASQIKTLMEQFDISDGEIDWLNSKNIRKILEQRTGTDYWADGPKRDKILTEINVASPVLGLAGRIDLMIDHGDNVLSLYDIKTGYGLNKEWENYLFKYGDTLGTAIWDNALNRAKLQIMLYALILKSQNPEIRFKQLKVLQITSENDLEVNSLRTEVDPQAFLEIIEKFYKNEQPEKYKSLLATSPNIFKASEYTTVTPQSVGLTSTSDVAMELKLKVMELQRLVLFDKHIVEQILKGDKYSKTRAQRIKQLMSEIIELKKDSTMSLASWNTDMSWLDTWLGSASYSTNPYVQLYYTMLSSAKQKVRNDYEPWRRKFDKLLENALKEIGINPKPATKLIGGPDSNKLFERFVKKDKFGNEFFITEEDEEFNELGSAQQELLFFILESNDQFFVNEKSTFIDPKTNKPIALANRVATYRKTKKGSNIPVTNLGLFNRELNISGERKSGTVFKWQRGFLPKEAPLLSDVARDHGWLSQPMLRHLWNSYMTTFLENSFERWNNTTEAIPLKGLGNKEIDASKNYSRDLEYVIDTFVKQNFYKQYLDEVYTFGMALQIYLKLQETSQENAIFNNTIGWFEDSLELHILGKKDTSNKWVRRPIKVGTQNGYAQFNFTKFLRSLKGFFVAPTMWLKPITGLPNGVFASLVTMKEGFKNSFLIKGDHANFGLNDLREGFAVATTMQTDAAIGKLRENKAYLLMEKYGYLPDNYDWFTRPNELLTARNKLFTSRTMMMFHTLPEEVVATALFVAQLKSMKFTNTEGKQTNMWEAYNVKENKVVWEGGVRGKRNVSGVASIPQYEEVTELQIEEANAIKFLYEKLHGGYRLDERVRLEYYVLGEMLLQFKKFLPGVLKNIGASRGWRNTQGYFEKTLDENGVPILKWTPQVVEGRWRLLAGVMLNYLGLRAQGRPEGSRGNTLLQFLGYQTNESYNWDDLTATQKEDLQDFMLTWVTFMAMFAGFAYAWDDNEEDLMAKVYKRIMNDMAITVNPMEILRNTTTTPVSWEKTRKLAGSTIDVSLALFWAGAGYDDKAFTKDNNLRGWKEFERNTPFLASLHSWQKALEESDDLDALMTRLK